MLSSRYNPHLTITPQTSSHRGASNLSGLDNGSSSYLGVFGGLTVDLMGDGRRLVHPHSVGSALLKFCPWLQTPVRPPASSRSSVWSKQLRHRLTDIIQDESQNLPHAFLLQNANGLQARMLLFGSSLLNGMFWWEGEGWGRDGGGSGGDETVAEMEKHNVEKMWHETQKSSVRMRFGWWNYGLCSPHCCSSQRWRPSVWKVWSPASSSLIRDLGYFSYLANITCVCACVCVCVCAPTFDFMWP